MAFNTSNPAVAAAATGSGGAFPGGNCGSPIPPKAHYVQQAKIELLRDDIAANVSAMYATLEAALAMHAADDDIGLLYGFRRARAYWNAIAASASELVHLQEGARK